VLVLCLGPATRLSEYIMNSTKRYEARVRLGATTATYDAEGEIVQQADASHVTREQVEVVLTAFVGEIDQLPPMYSAIKQGGRKLYELARAGETVERAPRRITIHDLTITDWSPPEFTLTVTCSAGTYIRSLAHDLGQALGIGAYLARLVRVASGQFTLANAVALDTLLASDSPTQYLVTPRAALADWPTVDLSAAELNDVSHGRAIPASDADEDVTAFTYAPDGTLAAVLRAEGGLWKPQKVFLP
jgi:tRNA pseudouridine55 synthase